MANESYLGTFQAESGMKWSEWLDSKYNTKNYTSAPRGGTSYNGVKSPDAYWLYQADAGTVVKDSDSIMEGHQYVLL